MTMTINTRFGLVILVWTFLSNFSCDTRATITSAGNSASDTVNTNLKLISENETLNLQEGDRTVLILFSDKLSPQNIELSWNLAGEGSDFAVRSGASVLEKGKKSFSITLEALDDSTYLPNRHYQLQIFSLNQSIENTLEIDIQVIEDDPQYLVQFQNSTLSITEGDPTVLIPIQINTPHPSNLIVEYLITGSAVANTDYVLTNPGSVTILAGESQSQLELTIPEDLVVESPKTLVLTLYRTNLTGIELISPSQITIQINDNDLAISPTSAFMLPQETLQFQVSGGDGQYSYSIIEPTSSSISATGQLTSGLTHETFSVRIEDGSGLFANSQIEVIDIKTHPNLGLWLRADTLALNNLDPVSVWNDETDFNRDFTQSGPSAQPILISDAINSKPAVRFDGANDVLSSDYLPVTGTNPRSITTVLTNLAQKVDSVVYSWGSTTNWRDAFGLIVFTPPTNSFVSHAFGTYVHLSASNAYPSSYYQPLPNTPYIITHQYDGTQLLYYVNGALKGSQAIDLPTKSTNRMRIGSRFSGLGFFQGDLSELVLHENITSTDDREKMECYLSRKYNITIFSSRDCGSNTLSLPYDGHLTLAAGQSHLIQAKGGTSPYHYQLLSGSGTLNASTGEFTASNQSGINRVRIEDAWGQGIELDITVTPFSRPLSWLDLSNQSNLVPDSRVSQIRDKSGNRHTWSQTVPDHQPLLRANSINSLPALEFSGDQFLAGSFLPPIGANPRTFALVVTEAASGILFDYGGSQNCNNKFTFEVNEAESLYAFDRQCTTSDSTAINLNEPQIIIVSYNGTHVIARRNGSQILSVATGLSTTNPLAIKLGSDRRGSGYEPPFQGKIAEFLAFDSHLSLEEMQALESYLATKFNISLPSATAN